MKISKEQFIKEHEFLRHEYALEIAVTQDMTNKDYKGACKRLYDIGHISYFDFKILTGDVEIIDTPYISVEDETLVIGGIIGE